MASRHAESQETAGHRHAQAAGQRRDAHARAVRHPAQSRRQADEPGRARRGGARRPTCWCRPSPTGSTPRCSRRPAPQLKLIANFGNGVDNIDVATARAARHHRHQHAGRADRGHRRHDHGADPGGAAAAGRRRQRADRRQRLDRLVADLDARPPHLGQAARHHRHGPHRPGGGAPRHAPSACRSTITTAAASRRKIEEELEATYWESLDQMLARMDIVSVNCPHTPATYHLLSARRLKLLRPRGLYRQHRARRGDRRERAGAHDRGGRASPAPASTCSSTSRRSTRSCVKLARAGKVVLLPHMGSATLEGRIDMGEKVIINIRTFMDGHRPPDRVLPSML